eukprot:403361369
MRQISQAIEINEKIKQIIQKDEPFQYVCNVCLDSRKLDQICDIIDTTKLSPQILSEEIDFIKTYCLVKLMHASYIHAVWIPFVIAEDLSKPKCLGFIKKNELYTYQDIINYHETKTSNDYGDNFHNILIPSLQPERILDQYKKGQYFLVKWKQIDHNGLTWENLEFIDKYYPYLKLEYFRMLQSQTLINLNSAIGAQYRMELIRKRDLTPNLVPIMQYQGTPEFINMKHDQMKLHEYQVEGLNWMIYSWFNRTNVILADEMGLGKTVQAIAFISYLLNVQQISRPMLIIAPLSTIDNWNREFSLWCPEAKVLMYNSEQKARQIAKNYEFFYEMQDKPNLPYMKKIRIPKFNVILTTYHFIQSDYKNFVSIDWRAIIIDEGQRLKSNESKLFRLASTLQTEWRLLLSGTPLQNNIGELFNLLEYLDPSKFNQKFRDDFQKKNSSSIFIQDQKQSIVTQKDVNYTETKQITQSLQDKLSDSTNDKTQSSILQQSNPESPRTQREDDLNIEQEQGALIQLQQILKPHILRRFKRDVFKTFPKKKEVIIRVEMTPRQKYISKCILQKNMEQLSQFEKSKSSAKVSMKSVMNILTLLRMVANHPLHLTEQYATEHYRQTQLYDKNKVNQDEQPQLHSLQDFLKDSAKLLHFDKMLDILIEQGHRTLVFSQFMGTLDILQDYLQAKQIQSLRLDGSTSNSKRQRLIDLFNQEKSPIKVFLLSTKAGGLGINLTSADTIFIYDSDFNPHNDIQALNRAHRIGQKNNVMIYRFACKNSVEERMLEMAKHKLMLDTVMVHGQKKNKDNNQNGKENRDLYQILRFGTKKLFENDDQDNQNEKFSFNDQLYEIDLEQLQVVLDREKQFKDLEEEEKLMENNDDGVRDYLSGFKVANLEQKIQKTTENQLKYTDLMDLDLEGYEEDDKNDNIFQKLSSKYCTSQQAQNTQPQIEQQDNHEQKAKADQSLTQQQDNEKDNQFKGIRTRNKAKGITYQSPAKKEKQLVLQPKIDQRVSFIKQGGFQNYNESN